MDPREADLNPRRQRGRSAEEIRREIDVTRCRMDRTVTEIQTRLSPRSIADQAVCALKEKARNVRQSMLNTLKDHPIPSALMGAGAAYLVACAVRDRMNRKPTAEDARIRRETAAYQQGFITGREIGMTPSSQRFQGRSIAGGAYSDAEEFGESPGRIRQVGESIRQRAADLGQRAADTASSLGQRVSETATSVKHRVSDTAQAVAHRTKDSARSASVKARDTFVEHPIAVVLGAMGLGIAAGLAIPASRREDQWFGSRRDELLRKAREMGEDTLARSKEAAKSVAACATEEAKHQLGSEGGSKSRSASQSGLPTMSPNSPAARAPSGPREIERVGRTETNRGASGGDSRDQGSVGRTKTSYTPARKDE